jgi:UDP-N-acetylmuramate--alanine ligase
VTVLPDAGVPEAVAAAARNVRRFSAGAPGPAGLTLAVPGAHNALNARAAIAALVAAGEDPDEAAAALADFPGVRRRLELKGTADGARVYDDYAHHPTEVRAALSALRDLAPDRLVAVFQPHLYSRTKAMAADFGSALALADEIVVLDVYPAREEPVGELAHVSGLDVARAAADRARGRRVLWAPALEDATEALRRTGGDGSIVVTLGAGDVHRVGEQLVAGVSGGDTT